MLEKLKAIIKKNKLLYKLLRKLYNIFSPKRKPSKNIIVRNYFKTNYTKNLLITYINNPFLKNLQNGSVTHSNQNEVKVIAKIFSNFNYNVDIIEYTYDEKLSLKEYDLLFGFGDIFEKSFYSKEFKGKRIFYATGAEPSFQINAEIKRVKEFNKRKNTSLLPKRLPPNFWPLSSFMSDAMIVYGNEWTISTWKNIYDGSILEQIGSNSFFDMKNYKTKEKEFVFIGSAGNIHKGLDICIDIFKELDSRYVLNIFSAYEEDFFQVYGELPENIKFHGFVDLTSEYSKKIIEKSKYILAPSCSEGQMTSLLLGIGNGLLPLATRETGVDLPKEYYLESVDSEYIKNKIEAVYMIEDKELTEKIDSISIEFSTKYTLKKFEECFVENIKILKEKGIIL